MIRKRNLVSGTGDAGSATLLKSDESLHMSVNALSWDGWWLWVEGLKERLNGCPAKWLV